jgi:hypothetical protein
VSYGARYKSTLASLFCLLVLLSICEHRILRFRVSKPVLAAMDVCSEACLTSKLAILRVSCQQDCKQHKYGGRSKVGPLKLYVVFALVGFWDGRRINNFSLPSFAIFFAIRSFVPCFHFSKRASNRGMTGRNVTSGPECLFSAPAHFENPRAEAMRSHSKKTGVSACCSAILFSLRLSRYRGSNYLYWRSPTILCSIEFKLLASNVFQNTTENW